MPIVDFHGTSLVFAPPQPSVENLDLALELYRDLCPVKTITDRTGINQGRLFFFLQRIGEPNRTGALVPPERHGLRTFEINGKTCVEFEHTVAIEGREDRVRFWRDYGEDAESLLRQVFEEYSDPTIKVTDISKRVGHATNWVCYTAVALGAPQRRHGGYKPTHKANSMTDRNRRVWKGETK